jgi:hypothetical protein
MKTSLSSRPADVTELAEGRLYALTHPFRLDGRVTTYPTDVDGFASMNTYVLVEHDRALLVDGGWTVDEQRILAGLDYILDGTSSLAVAPLRYGEFGGLCNYRAIAGRFPVDRLYGRIFGEPAEWLDFRPELVEPGLPAGGPLANVPAAAMRSNERIAVDAAGRRSLQLMVAPIRLLPMPWAYDEATRTLFTGDMFGWTIRREAAGPWTASEGSDPATPADVEQFLLGNRYWWLAGAKVQRLRDDLHEVFDRHEIETIAPGTGCVLRGRATVERHLQMLDDVLRAVEQKRSVGIEIGRRARRTAA